MARPAIPRSACASVTRREPVAVKCASIAALSFGIRPYAVSLTSDETTGGVSWTAVLVAVLASRNSTRARQAPFSYSNVGAITMLAPLFAVSAWIASRLETS